MRSTHQQWTVEVEQQLAEKQGGSRHTRVNCPACLTRAGKLDTVGSASVNTVNGWAKCHRCGWRTRIRGDWESFDVRELDPEEYDDCGVEQPSSYVEVTADLVAVTKTPTQYLWERRIPAQAVHEARVGYALEGVHAGRLILPAVASADWRQVGWVGRTARPGDKRRRYHQAEGMDTRMTFYNDDRLSDDAVEFVVVVEGAMDALRHWPYCVASWGKPRPEQVRRLVCSGLPTIFAGDADAWREYLAAAECMRAAGGSAWCVRLPHGVDPAVIPRKVFRDAYEYALTHRTDTDLA